MSTVAQATAKIQQIESALTAHLIGREDAVRATLVALLAREHIVLLGPTGSAKSYLVELVKDAIAAPGGGGLRLFEWLMSKYTAPDELFGPVSVQGLKQDQYRRITTSKLPEAELAFLDEVFKAGSAILNALLTILNERAFDNGPARVRVPLLSLVGASNELPEGDESGALFDRFMLRLYVDYVDDSGFAALLTLSGKPTMPTITSAELTALQAHADGVAVPPSIVETLVKLRRTLSQAGAAASDRRWRKSLALLRANAALDGRDTVEEDDLGILQHALWSAPEQRGTIAQEVGKLANPRDARAREIGDAATQVHADAMIKKDDTAAVIDAMGKLKKAKDELLGLHNAAKMEGRGVAKIEREGKRIATYLAELAEAMGL